MSFFRVSCALYKFPTDVTFTILVDVCQIDNQLYNAIWPAVMAPYYATRKEKRDTPKFFYMYVLKNSDKKVDVFTNF